MRSVEYIDDDEDDSVDVEGDLEEDPQERISALQTMTKPKFLTMEAHTPTYVAGLSEKIQVLARELYDAKSGEERSGTEIHNGQKVGPHTEQILQGQSNHDEECSVADDKACNQSIHGALSLIP